MFKSFTLPITRSVIVLLAAAATVLTSHTSAQLNSTVKPAEWTTELMMKLKQIGSVQLSPDGKRVLFTVRQAVMDSTRSEYLTQIYLANSDGSGLIPLTSGARSSDNPQWSPDGDFIACTSTRSGKSNVWLMRPNGDEPQMLTDVMTGVSSFKWSPDGKRIAFTARDPSTPQEEKAVREKDNARVVEEGLKGERLFVIPVEKPASGKREARQLTTGDYKVTDGPNRTDYDWSPDSRTIVFTSDFTPKPGVWANSDLSLVDVDSGQVKYLVKSAASERYPLYSPDGRWIAYLASDDPNIDINSNIIHVIASEGGTPRRLAVTLDQFGNLPAGSPLIGWSATADRFTVGKIEARSRGSMRYRSTAGLSKK